MKINGVTIGKPRSATAKMAEIRAARKLKMFLADLPEDNLIKKARRFGDKVRDRKNINYYVFGDEDGAKS